MAYYETIEVTFGKSINTLTEDCVVNLHEVLSKKYDELPELEPVSPPGVKDPLMLGSAVSRQHTAFFDQYKYDNPFKNCATLVIGVIKNHAFFNGNKRVGLLCLIQHLYANNYILSPGLKMDELYKLVLHIADSNLPAFIDQYHRGYRGVSGWKYSHHVEMAMDDQVDFLAWWLKRNTKTKSISIGGTVKCSELKTILEKKGLFFSQNGSLITVGQKKENKFLGISLSQPKIVNKKEYYIGSVRSAVAMGIVNKIRIDWGLTTSDGFDHQSFFEGTEIIDKSVVKYKKIIYRLSKT